MIKQPRFKTERITFDSGDWWEFRSSLSVGLDREFASISMGTQSILDSNSDALAHLAARMDIFVLNCTVSWSYGEVTESTLHSEIPAEHYQNVGDLMVARYSPLVLYRIETLLSAYSSHLNSETQQDSPSLQNSSTPT